MNNTNCRNCGAPLGRDGNCEYCGTKSLESHESYINITGERISVGVVSLVGARDVNGRLVRLERLIGC